MYAPAVVQVIANHFPYLCCLWQAEEMDAFPKSCYDEFPAIRAAFPVVVIGGSNVSSEPCADLPRR